MADPLYEDGLVLANTFIQHDGMGRQAEVTYAVFDIGLGFTAQQWAVFLQDAFADIFENLLDNQAVITKTTTIKGDGSSDFTTGESTAAGRRGVLSMSALPSNCACLIRKLTAFGGRRNRGRIYVPWILAEGDVDELGFISGARVTGIQTGADGWLTELTGENSNMCIANRVYDLPWDNPNRQLIEVNAGKEVTSLVCETQIATQRRRLDR